MASHDVPQNHREVVRFMARRSGPPVLLLIIVVTGICKTILGGWSGLDVAIVAAFLLLRGVVEWLVHSYLHHARALPILGVRLVTPIHTMHLEHHKNPGDMDTFLFKGGSLLFVAAVVLSMTSLFTLSLDTALTVTLGFMTVIMIHEWVHVICHSAIQPRSALMRYVVSYHRMHHHKDGRRWLSVSSRLGDILFRTN